MCMNREVESCPGSAGNRAGAPGGDEPIFLTICSIALCRTSGSFSEINGREARSVNSGAMAVEPSFNVSLSAARKSSMSLCMIFVKMTSRL